MMQDVKQIYLCKPNLEIITVLNGLQRDSVNYTRSVKDYNVLSFDVDRYITINGHEIKSNGYEELDTYMYLLIDGFDAFQMQAPQVANDGNKETKHVIAYSIEKELEGSDFVNLKINTGDKDSQEMLVDGNIDDLGFPKEYITFYNPDRPELSFLDIILQKNPNWSVDKEDIDRKLWFKKMSITAETINLYALLTSQVAPKMECVFMFDTINRKVKAIHKDTLLDDYIYDTNVFISLRTLMDSVTVSVDEGSIYTRFNCTGQNTGNNALSVADWNYNDKRIFNIDYFLKEPYFTEEQIENVKEWIKYRDDNREAFANISRQQSELREKIDEIEYRVPSDGCDTDQWTEMKPELLHQNANYYVALLESLQVSVDTRDKNITHIKDPLDENNELYIPKFRNTFSGNNIPTLTFEDKNEHVGDVYVRNVSDTLSELYKYTKHNSDNTYSWELDFKKYTGNDKPTLENFPINGSKEYDSFVGNYYYQTSNKKSYEFVKINNVEYDWVETAKIFEPLFDSNNRKVFEGKGNPPSSLTTSGNIGSFYKEKNSIYKDTINKNGNEKSCRYYYLNSSMNWVEIQYHSYVDMFNDDYYLPLLYDRQNGYGGYATYSEITKYIIPNIDVAIYNVYKINDDVISYNQGYDTNWSLYGTKELENKKKVYEEKLEALKDYEKPWSELTDEEKNRFLGNEDSYNLYHDEIADISYLIGDENTKDTLLYYLKQLSAEVEELENQYDELTSQRLNFVNNAQIKYTDLNGDVHYNFNLDEKTEKIIQTLFIDTDYTNNNIISTSIDTSVTIIDVEKELYDDSVNKLSEVSQPQFKFVALIDNLLDIEEFKIWDKDIELLNFIRLAVREDWIVKQRIIQIDYNPCDVGGNFALIFSNMITSNSGRNDLTQLIDSENTGGSKNSIMYGIGNSDSEVEYLSSLLSLMTKNNIFTNAVSNVIKGTSANFDSLELINLFSEYIKASKIEADTLSVKGQAQLNEIVSKSIDSEYIVTELIKANKEIVQNLFVEGTGFMDNLTVANKAIITDEYVHDLVAGTLSVSDLKAGDITLSENLRIISEDGQIIMNGDALQFIGYEKDKNGNIIKNDDGTDKTYVGIQLGFDTNNNPSLIVKNSKGATIIEPTGITEHAIPNGLIKNDMVKDGTLSKDKLSFSVDTETDEDGNEYMITNLNNIYTGDGQKFGVEYTTFKEQISKNIVGENLFSNSKSLEKTWYAPKIENGICTLENMMEELSQSPKDGYWSWKPNTNYVVSIDAYGEVGDEHLLFKLNVPNGDNKFKEVILTTTKTRYSFEFTTSDVTNVNFAFMKSSSDGIVYLEHPKLEEGTVATTWNSNPLDLEMKLTSEVSGIKSAVDNVKKSIDDEIWRNSIYEVKDADGNTVEKKFSNYFAETLMDLTGITSRVSATETLVGNPSDEDESTMSVFERLSEIKQESDKISLLVKSIDDGDETEESSIVLTPEAITAITSQFVIKDEEGKEIIVENGQIKAEAITANMLNTNAIMSNNYDDGKLEDGYEEGYDGTFSKAGTFLDLENGKLHMPNLYSDTDGNLTVAGTIEADGGRIGSIGLDNDGLHQEIKYCSIWNENELKVEEERYSIIDIKTKNTGEKEDVSSIEFAENGITASKYYRDKLEPIIHVQNVISKNEKSDGDKEFILDAYGNFESNYYESYITKQVRVIEGNVIIDSNYTDSTHYYIKMGNGLEMYNMDKNDKYRYMLTLGSSRMFLYNYNDSTSIELKTYGYLNDILNISSSIGDITLYKNALNIASKEDGANKYTRICINPDNIFINYNNNDFTGNVQLIKCNNYMENNYVKRIYIGGNSDDTSKHHGVVLNTGGSISDNSFNKAYIKRGSAFEILDRGHVQTKYVWVSNSIPASGYVDYEVTFNTTFTEPPFVVAGLAINSTSGKYGLLSVCPRDITGTGCIIRIYNADTQTRSAGFRMIAIGTSV